MGLRDLLKRKKSTEADADLVGGLTDTNWWEAGLQSGLGVEQESEVGSRESGVGSQVSSPSWQGFSGSAGQAEEAREEQEEEGKKQEEEKAGGVLSGLDIFTSETGDDEDANKLAAQLPEVDIQDLLRECWEMASLLREY